MKFGVFSLMQWPEDRSQSDVFRNEMQQLIESEAQGYDAVWFAEHHFSRYGLAGSTHLNAAYIAARTSRIRIGTAVTIVPFLHPIRIAEEIAMLDRLSNGRIDWGAGRGYQGHEFSGFGLDIKKSHLVFREALEIRGALHEADRRSARFELQADWLSPGRYIIEMKTTERTHFPLRRYVLEVR